MARALRRRLDHGSPRSGPHSTTPPLAVILRLMRQESQDLPLVSLLPTPTIEAYKKDVDRTLLRENLKLTVAERIEKMVAALAFTEELRRSRSGTTK